MDFDSIHTAQEDKCLDFIAATQVPRKPRRTRCKHCDKLINPGCMPAHLRTHGKTVNKAKELDWGDFQQTRTYFDSELNKPLSF